MFRDAVAFNQPLSSFSTTKVTSVRVKFPVHLRSWTSVWLLCFSTYLFSDERHVQCNGLQSATIIIWYCQGCWCECICLWSPTWETGFWLPTPTHIIIRWLTCSGEQRPSIRTCQLSILLRLQMWEHNIYSGVQLDKEPVPDHFLPTLLSLSADFLHVLRCNSLQPGPVSFWRQLAIILVCPGYVCWH